MRSILLRAFGRPQGLLGRLGGVIMARTNADCGAWVTDLLEVDPDDRVLEVGFGPGIVIQRLSSLVPAGSVAGIDASQEMVGQARARNATAVGDGRIDLRLGSVEHLPFDDASFDKALAINSMQVWPDAVAGLLEIRRVMKAGGKIALGFTSYSGQPREGVVEKLEAAGFTAARLVDAEERFCALATKTS
ncbi:class I SAM-dependent methyltransferase [Bradyrhizobium sp. NAS96.2]|uniref:class I SAM-dependent methyltransferase n=1 Tax=Bradyrhizobium sp. NAS96.2 TaxID=1680160 RepID=UPI0009FA8172|nr:class I SAM-dependent methyltransferase [Bradyrhizobium sp. NAS96.2]